MEITYNRTVTEYLQLPAYTVTEIAAKKIEQMLGEGEYLREENGKVVVKQDDPWHRHGSISEHNVRDATELDIALFAVLKALRNESQQ